MERLWKEAVKASQPFDFDFRIQLPSGEMKWVNCKGAAHYDDAGNPDRVSGVNVDITERKMAEEELARARNTLAEAQKIAHVGSFEYVAATLTTVWSEEEYRIYGLDPAGPSPTYDLMLQNCIHPDDAPLLHETFTQAMQSRSVYELEHRIVLPDGSVRWVYDRAHPYFDVQGELARYVGTTLDITERKMVEEALQQSEEKFRSIFDNSPLGVVHADAEGIVTACNDSFVRIVGTPREKLIGLSSIRDLNDENLMAAVREALAGGMGHYEGQYTSRITNKTIHIKADIAPMFNRDGAVVGAIGIYEDIAARLKMERELRESEENYRRLHETMRDAFVSVNMNGRIQEANHAYQEMLGYSSEELRKLTYEDLTPEKWHAIEASIVRDQILSKGYSDIYEKEYRKKDGTILPVELRTFLIQDDYGVPSSMWAIVRDVSQRKQNEAAIRDLNKNLERRVQERTAELEHANRVLQEEMVERRRAEQAVTVERQRLYEVLETLPVYVCLLDSDYRMPFANRYFRETFAEPLGRRCHDFLFNLTEPCEICETYTVDEDPGAASLVLDRPKRERL